jgi:hypothetical protein
MIGVTDYQPARLRALGDIMSEYQAPSSRNAWAASSESALWRATTDDDEHYVYAIAL